MKRVTLVRTISVAHLERAAWDACANWVRWRDDFQHPDNSPWCARPIFRDFNRFDAFCMEYGLVRTIWPKEKGKAEAARLNLLKLVALAPKEVLEDVGVLHCFLRENSKGFLKRPPGISFCSKVLCFKDPEKFPPMDRFNRIGLNYLRTGKRLSHPQHSDYRRFVEEFRNLLESRNISDQISQSLRDIGGHRFPKTKLAARVLDISLMFEGGYGPPEPQKP